MMVYRMFFYFKPRFVESEYVLARGTIKNGSFFQPLQGLMANWHY